MNLASNVVVDMQMEGVQISLEPSPTDLRGLTHRELGDHTANYSEMYEEPIIVTGMPSYDELVKNGMGPYLNEPTT